MSIVSNTVRSQSPSRNQSGFTLLEVMIAVLVMMVGILGVSSMQLMSYDANKGAYYRSQAIYIASDILERMRNNTEAYDNYLLADAAAVTALAGTASPGCATAIAGCTPAQTALEDMRQWGANFVNVFGVADYRPTIPGGTATVARAVGTNEITVVVSWRQEDFDGDEDGSDGSGTRSMLTRAVSLTSVLE